ncbi:hypothetical protein BHE74_00037703 [Ensete ventricosum]|nr:hypothetical protein BHE74_00037703 [Ensete ventricosum]
MAVASAIGNSTRGRTATASAIGDLRRGSGFFSPRHGTASRARNSVGCIVIGAGFIAALQSCDKSGVERATIASIGDSGVGRVVASSPLGGWRSLGRGTPLMRAVRRDTLLHIPLLCSSGMLLRWLLPSGLCWLLHSRMPLSAAASSFTAGGGCSSSAAAGYSPVAAGYLTAGGGCSSPATAGSSPAT